ncbi:EAL domain-containing protein [Burkholderia plantarii]|uniref:EAL domain-containing protein n=1 Tax=Burkholderia plantarii TaxID=41899 RepID=UPI0018DCE4BC|nr:EAL domain-containing protein [Burkholderia plantarii]MBI0328629.1 EAL domain-containing protein [Burkholderia plantarii]
MTPAPTDHFESIVSDAERGLDQGEFFFMLQPKVRLPEHRLCGFEYLIRWRHPEGAVLHPAYFISVVEDSELAGQFTALLLDRAARRLAHWKAIGHGDLSIAINLSADELGRAELPRRLADACRAHVVAPQGIEIELTCTVEPERLDWLVEAIHAVQAVGARVALDDLGAGFNSLTLLQQLPADIVKFDRSLLERVPADAEAAARLAKLAAIARERGKRIVLAGIENAAQLAWACLLGDLDGQGFFIGKPCDESRADAVIGQYRPAAGV